MNSKSAFGSTYFAIFGAIVLAFGILELIVLGAYGMEGVCWGPLEMADPDMGGLMLVWRAIILIAAGLIYLSSVTNFMDVRQLAKSVAASIMIWIVAGMGIFGMITGSIPGEETWFNPPMDFLAAYGPPYMPELYLLLPSLVILYFIAKRRAASQAA